MAGPILTFTASTKEVSSGIPETITITSDVPATIYYTIDGSTPDLSSAVYTDPIAFLTDINSAVLSALGVDSLDVEGAILTQTFAPDTTRVTKSRNVGMEGVVLDRANMGPDIPYRYDSEGSVGTFLDIDPAELDIIRKEKGYDGIQPGTALTVGIPTAQEEPKFNLDAFIPFSTTEKAQFFHPNAKVVLIDNRKDNEVQVTLRGYGSLSDPYKEFGGKRIRESAADATHITGGFVRRFYDAANNIMVSYYYDNMDNKYVKNIQTLPNNIAAGYRGMSPGGMPLVFQWIGRGRQSSY